MVQTITLKMIDGSIGAIIPKDMAERQHFAANDEIFVVERPDGILLTRVDPTMQESLNAYVELAKENQAGMAALAKL